MIERDLITGEDDAQPGRKVGTVRVTEDGQLEVRHGDFLVYSASLEHFAWSMMYLDLSRPALEQRPPPGAKIVRTTLPDGRTSYELIPAGS